MNDRYISRQRAAAAAWKARTSTLPTGARRPAPWVDHRGRPRGRYDFCLPAGQAGHNLLPETRDGALALFRELDIPWHCGIGEGPGNHLLSSQVQCVNALYPMVHDPARIVAAFGEHVDVAEVLPLEQGRYLTFEYIGPTDFFGEGRGAPRRRGTRCTSVDAGFRYRTTSGSIELALVEWKYTESYLEVRKPDPAGDRTRADRYKADYEDPDGPLRAKLPLAMMLDEPFYQLMRQQLLAHRLEHARAEGADVVRVLHVLPPDNTSYQASLVRAEHRALGDTVDAVWQRLLRRPDQFTHVDPALFLDPAITSGEYVARYRSPVPATATPAMAGV